MTLDFQRSQDPREKEPDEEVLSGIAECCQETGLGEKPSFSDLSLSWKDKSFKVYITFSVQFCPLMRIQSEFTTTGYSLPLGFGAEGLVP